MSLELLFKIVIDYGEYVRKNNFDGLIYWNKIKSFLSKDAIFNKDKIEINWNIKLKLLNGSILSNIEEIYDYFYCELGMKGEETDENDESNSYFKIPLEGGILFILVFWRAIVAPAEPLF